MNEEIVKTLADKNVNYTAVFIILFCVAWLTERMFKIYNHQRGNKEPANGTPKWKEINQKLEDKVNGNDCLQFKTRIGKESDEHRSNINKMNDKLGAIHADVSFIKGKMESA